MSKKIKLNKQTQVIIALFAVVLVVALVTDFGQTLNLGVLSTQAPPGYMHGGNFKCTSASGCSADFSKVCSGTLSGVGTLHLSWAIAGFTISKAAGAQEMNGDGSETLTFTYKSTNGDSGTEECTLDSKAGDVYCYFNNGETEVVTQLTSANTLDVAAVNKIYNDEIASCKAACMVNCGDIYCMSKCSSSSDPACIPKCTTILTCVSRCMSDPVGTSPTLPACQGLVNRDEYEFYILDHARTWNFEMYVDNDDCVVWDCTPGEYEVQECWDGTTVNYQKCSVNGEWENTGLKCPAECGDGKCASTEKTSCPADCTSTPTPCAATGTKPANSYWSTTTCQYECNTGYTKSGLTCVAITPSCGNVLAVAVPNAIWQGYPTCDYVCNTGYEEISNVCVVSGGDDGTIPPSPEPDEPTTPTTDDTMLYVVLGVLVVAAGGLIYFAVKKR